MLILEEWSGEERVDQGEFEDKEKGKKGEKVKTRDDQHKVKLRKNVN